MWVASIVGAVCTCHSQLQPTIATLIRVRLDLIVVFSGNCHHHPLDETPPHQIKKANRICPLPSGFVETVGKALVDLLVEG